MGEEDPAFAGGSYVIVQKYLHDLAGWNALPTEAQERIIGRTKLSDIELDDAVKPTSAHNALTTIVENGKEIKILRENMAFGRPGHGEFGTYFIGYARSPRTTEQMLENMFVGRPAGQLRSAAGLQPRGHRRPVFRPFALVPRGRHTRPRPPHRGPGTRGNGNRGLHLPRPAARRRLARHRFSERKIPGE